MSRPDMPDPAREGATQSAALEHVIVPRATDLGDMMVRRALPSTQRQMVGPFIFFDEMGPGEFLRGKGLDVRPHPHIGLSTVTYLFDGQIFHRDSLGSALPIKPGELNLMTAGRGIVHSERTPQELRATGSKIWGIQTWMALPKRLEETDPAFVHHDENDLPLIEGDGKRVRLIMGEMSGARAQVATHTATFYADASLDAGAVLPLDAHYEERAVYIASGYVEIDRVTYGSGRLLVLKPGAALDIRALSPARLLLLGGERMDGPRFIWWNFVASSREAIKAAGEAWERGEMPKVPGDETEFIPLKK
jgi:redox-sensitive bicupin YhaK (pirin superfamily)